MNSAPFDLVIFDIDGTLVDSLPDIAWALNVTLSGAGLPTLPVDTVAQLVGDGAAKLIDRAVTVSHPTGHGDPEQNAALYAAFMTAYAHRVCVDSRLYPGIRELLDGLSARRVALAAVTNKPGPLARTLLSTLGIAAHFRETIGDLDGYPRKPAPDAALAVLQRAGVLPSRVVVVGDGLPDMRMAQALRSSSIAAGWGYVAPPLLQAEHPTHLALTVEEATHLLLP